VLTILSVFSGLLAVAYAVARGLPARDWRPGLAAVTAGFIAANVAFVLLTLGVLAAPVLCVVWAGGFAMLLCTLWHAALPRSWHVAWDALVGLSGQIHLLGTLVFLITALVTVCLLAWRVLRALDG